MSIVSALEFSLATASSLYVELDSDPSA
jgi:hypothetical protein